MTRVAFLGLGAMGAPMVRRIVAAGFPTTVWNRNAGRAAPFVDAARGDYERARVSGLGQKYFAHVVSFLGGELSK